MDRSSRKKLQSMESKLLAAPRRAMCDGAEWATGVPDAAGVYAVWQSKPNTVVYVGQTSCLSKRMADLGRWQNHTCRRKLGRKLSFDGSNERLLSTELAKR